MAEWRMDDLRILVADDNLESVALLEELLSGLRMETVYCASSGWAALALLGSETIDLLICERSLRTMNGVELTRYLPTESTSPSPTVPVVMVSERVDQPILLEARDAGINEFLLNPPSRDSLARHIDVAMNVPHEFVRSEVYVGPNRRRGGRHDYAGGERRALSELLVLGRESATAEIDFRILAASKGVRKPRTPRHVNPDAVEIISVPGRVDDATVDDR